MLLYHGSYTEVPEPDLKKCAKFKDFGRGFYLTSSHAQAMSFSRLSLRKARENGIVPSSQMHGCVSVFRASLRGEPNVKALVFPTAGVAWLKCVAAHRREGAFPEDLEELADYDIIVGKVANDPTNNTLVTFLSGGYGSLQTEHAMRMCIELLLPNRLKDQYCFRTERSLRLLSFLRSERVQQ